VDDLTIERLPAGPAREALLPLLLEADESEPEVRGYMQEGDLYVLHAAGDPAPLGMTLTIPLPDEPGAVELKAVAIDPTLQSRGLGKRMLALVLADLRERGATRAIVGTSNAGIGQIAFYQKAGFRLWRIEQDFFTPERGYDPDSRENGIQHRDMVWMDQELSSLTPNRGPEASPPAAAGEGSTTAATPSFVSPLPLRWARGRG
jgi:ribosomal protein S18 acetylase RimI-like enzyme